MKIPMQTEGGILWHELMQNFGWNLPIIEVGAIADDLLVNAARRSAAKNAISRRGPNSSAS